MKKETEKNQKKAKKPDLKFKKEKVKDLDPDKASDKVKGGGGHKNQPPLTVAYTTVC